MNTRASNGKFTTPTKIPQAFTIQLGEDHIGYEVPSKRKSCLVASVTKNAPEEVSQEIKATCR